MTTSLGSAASRGVTRFEQRRGSLGQRRSTKTGSSGSARSTKPRSVSSSPTFAKSEGSGSMTLTSLVQSTVGAAYRSTRSEQGSTSALYETVEVWGGDREVSSITTLDIERLIEYYLSRDNKPATINRKLAVVSRALSHARHLGVRLQEIRIRRLREDGSRTRVLTKQEQTALLETAESLSPSFAFYLRFLLVTGCRVSEALKLAWGHIDLERGWVRFERTKSDTPRGVPIPEDVVAVLSDLKRGGKTSPFGDLSQRQVTYQWNKCRTILGFDDDPEFVPHALRHTCATELVAAGVSIQVIQKWLGHRTLSMTQRYAHVHDEMLVAAMARRT